MDEPRAGQLVWVVNNTEDLEHIWFALKPFCFSVSIYPTFIIPPPIYSLHYTLLYRHPTLTLTNICTNKHTYTKLKYQNIWHAAFHFQRILYPLKCSASISLPTRQPSGHICTSPSLHVYRAVTTVRNQTTCFTIRGNAVVDHCVIYYYYFLL